jgi:DNA-binding NarL/FixJ family response regulator
MAVTKVWVVAPFEPLRLGLTGIISSAPDLEVLGDCVSLAELVANPKFRDADVLVVDSQSVVGAPQGTYAHLNEWLPALRVLFLGTAEDMRTIRAEDIPAYMRLNTVGFLLKDGPSSRLIEAVRLVGAGTFVCETALIRHILTRLSEWASYSDEGGKNGQGLSERESQVLMMVARGLSNREIAQEIFLSEGTVKAHVSHIMSKLGLDRRMEMVRYALSTGLLPLSDDVPEEVEVST